MFFSPVWSLGVSFIHILSGECDIHRSESKKKTCFWTDLKLQQCTEIMQSIASFLCYEMLGQRCKVLDKKTLLIRKKTLTCFEFEANCSSHSQSLPNSPLTNQSQLRHSCLEVPTFLFFPSVKIAFYFNKTFAQNKNELNVK